MAKDRQSVIVQATEFGVFIDGLHLATVREDGVDLEAVELSTAEWRDLVRGVDKALEQTNTEE